MLNIVKKEEPSKKRELATRLLAVVAALGATAIIMVFLGLNPFEVYAKMIEGATGTAYRFQETINKTIPLVILSLGIAVAFKMKFWNIGAEGQFYMGAFGAAWVAFSFPEAPALLLIPMMLLAGFLCGGLWAMIPALLKAKWHTSETLVTLMMNYIATTWITYLQYGPWKDPKGGGFPRMPYFSDNAVLPEVFGIHIGWIIALLLVGVVYVLFKQSKLGYEIAVVGESDTTARYAGMSPTKVMLIAILISGGLCGIAGTVQASGIEHSLTNQLSGGLGFTAIITTWLSKLSAPAIVIVSLLFAILLQGGAYIQPALQVSSSLADLIQGTILFFVLGSEFFLNYRFVRKHKAQQEV